MRLSCNGCRVLRRGCTPECPIRTSLQWINSPQSQSNATLFLAKFYGRQGLLNLLTTSSSQLQPAILKSLLYEACGRMVNPVFGSTGLFSTGNWHLCEAAVKAVLSGAPIQQAQLDGATSFQLEACDIRHVAKGDKSCGSDALRKVKSRNSKFKRRGAAKPRVESTVDKVDGSVSRDSGSGLTRSSEDKIVCGEAICSVSRDSGSGLTRANENKIVGGEADSGSIESLEPARVDIEEIELQLTLGWGPIKRPTTLMMPRVGLDFSG